jgi:multiple sugar transport system permease protein
VSPNWTLNNNKSVIEKLGLVRAPFNSALLSVVKTFIILYTSALAAYVLEKTRLRGRKVLFLVVLCTMMMPNYR